MDRNFYNVILYINKVIVIQHWYYNLLNCVIFKNESFILHVKKTLHMHADTYE